MSNNKKCCDTCVHHKPSADEFGCDDEESETYETSSDDYCEEYEEG